MVAEAALRVTRNDHCCPGRIWHDGGRVVLLSAFRDTVLDRGGVMFPKRKVSWRSTWSQYGTSGARNHNDAPNHHAIALQPAGAPVGSMRAHREFTADSAAATSLCLTVACLRTLSGRNSCVPILSAGAERATTKRRRGGRRPVHFVSFRAAIRRLYCQIEPDSHSTAWIQAKRSE